MMWLKKGKAVFKGFVAMLLSLYYMAPVYANSAMQAMPLPEGVSADDDILKIFKGLAGQIALVVIGLVGLAGFIMVAWNALGKFQECVKGKADWGSLGVLVLVGIVILMFNAVLLYVAWKVFNG